jgi:hypothetical protein
MTPLPNVFYATAFAPNNECVVLAHDIYPELVLRVKGCYDT